MENPTSDRSASEDSADREGRDGHEPSRPALSLVDDPCGTIPYSEDGAWATGTSEDKVAMAMYAAMLPRGRILAGVKRGYLLMAGGVGLLLSGFVVGRHLPASNTPVPSAVSLTAEAAKAATPVPAVPVIPASAEPVLVNAPVTAEIVADQQAPSLAAIPAPVPSATQLAPKQEPVPAAAETAENQSIQVCRLALKRRTIKGIGTACESALAADASLANPLLALARAQFERGRAAEAAVWARKIVRVNGLLADAYLIIGVAEQEARRPAAAEAAYQRYLELAPKGRYANDVRSSLKSL